MARTKEEEKKKKKKKKSSSKKEKAPSTPTFNDRVSAVQEAKKALNAALQDLIKEGRRLEKLNKE